MVLKTSKQENISPKDLEFIISSLVKILLNPSFEHKQYLIILAQFAEPPPIQRQQEYFLAIKALLNISFFKVLKSASNNFFYHFQLICF